MADDLQSLINRRQEEARTEQARVAQERQKEQERQVRRDGFILNFQLNTATSLSTLAGQLGQQLRGVAELVSRPQHDRATLQYRKLGGSGATNTAWIQFAVDDEGVVSWEASLDDVPPGSKPMAEMTYAVVRGLAEQFIKAALA
jgi:hypothetical protein